MNAKNTEKKSQIHENADANITYDFGDDDISRSRSRLPHGHTVNSVVVRLVAGLKEIQGSDHNSMKHCLIKTIKMMLSWSRKPNIIILVNK